METKTRNIGIKAQKPQEVCKDKKCPFHGSLKVRGQSFVGTVIAGDVHHSATVEWPRRILVQKYERYEKRRSKVRVHNPACIAAKEGDVVRIHGCRPLSKTKHFVIVENIGKDVLFSQKRELKEEGKIKDTKKEQANKEKGAEE